MKKSVNPRRFPIFHVPHDGTECPPELMEWNCVPEDVFLAYHSEMRDLAVTEMVPPAFRKNTVRFPVSRLLCDVERFIGPEEVMEQYGMGFCYEKAYDGSSIKKPDGRCRSLAKSWYDRHHLAVNRLCRQHTHILFLDMHSYTDKIIPPFARAEGRKTPDLCIGTDPVYTPAWLTGLVQEVFSGEGFSTAENVPYSGVYVPEAVMDGTAGCDFAGVMLEFNRRCYCKEDGTPDRNRLDLVQSLISRILDMTGAL